MTRSLFQAAILCGRFVQGETRPIERYVIAPAAMLIVALIFGGILQ